MKFKIIEPVNQIESNLFIRHKVEELKKGSLIQKCVLCGEVIEDYTPRIVCSGGGESPKNGLPAGNVYVNKSGNTGMRITQLAIDIGIFSTPKEVVDCTTINS